MDKVAENCIARFLSWTTPKDVCRLSLVSTIFSQAAGSDDVWEKFLPTDYKEIITQAANPPDYVNGPKTFKELFFWLCDHPLILDQGTKSFSLDKGSGKKCYMIAAMDLNIAPPDRPQDVLLPFSPDSRFGEIKMFLGVKKLEIRGELRMKLLSKNTSYTTFLVYKQTLPNGIESKPVEVTVSVIGGNIGAGTGTCTTTKRRKLNTHSADMPFNDGNKNNSENYENEVNGKPYSRKRGDGWLEIKLTDFYMGDDGIDGDLNLQMEMSLAKMRTLIIEGIEIRPKVN